MNKVHVVAAGLVFAALQAPAQVLPPVTTPLDPLDARREALQERLESRIEREAAERAAAETAPDAGAVVDDGTALIDQARDAAKVEEGAALIDQARTTAAPLVDTVSNAAQTGVSAAGGLLRPFAADVDPFGQPIEKNVLVVLVDEHELQQVLASGMRVIAQRDMAGLSMTLVTLEAANGYALVDKALELRRALPDAAVDFNHLYRYQQDAAGEDAPADAAPSGGAPVRVGIIDSAVAPEHAALRGLFIEREDFVTFDGTRPLGHGTAVASLVADASGGQADILAASVFFQVPGHAPGASTESLVAALNWLALEDVDAINMSLAGPANTLLEHVLGKLAADGGPPVIAAVGNNGPAGEPLYPGAYEAVIGVTAVDRENRVFRYANRGEHVDFAARGVNVKVANADGGWRIESGTSMASPRVAVIAGLLRRQTGSRGDALKELLAAGATDLGRQGFDPVFGHGLLTEPPVIAARQPASE